jgi:hypothetical protein
LEMSPAAALHGLWWIDKTDLLGRLESKFFSLEITRYKVGIGVATGAGLAFAGDFETLDVEPTRELPLATTANAMSNETIWGGRGVINPFSDYG